MSEAAAKADRRAIRRAFGDEALALIDKHAEAITKAHDRISNLIGVVHQLPDKVKALENDGYDIETDQPISAVRAFREAVAAQKQASAINARVDAKFSSRWKFCRWLLTGK